MSSTAPSLPSRRAVARGVAWSIPAVAAATAAPAFAASAVTCPTMPSSSTWTRTQTGTVSNKNEQLNGTAFAFYSDTDNLQPATVTFTTTIPVVAGTTYNLRFAMQTAKGYSNTCATVNTGLKINAVMNGSTQTLGTFSTQGSGTVVAPPVSCTDTTRTSRFGANGAVGATYTFDTKLTPTSSGNATLSLVFSMDSTNAGNNDDWIVTPSFTTCSR